MAMWNKTIYILFNLNTAARNRSVIFYYMLLMLCQCLESHFWQIWKRSFTAPDGLSHCWSEFCTGPGYGTMANQDKTLTSRFRWVILSAGSSAPQTSWGYDLFLSFRCTVRWLIRVESCPWLYGMIFVLNGSTDWRSARFYICSSTHWSTVIRTGLDHTSAHSLLWLFTLLVWLQSFLVASFLMLHLHLGLFDTGSILGHFLKKVYFSSVCGCSVGCRDQPESSKSCFCSDSDSSKKCSASVGSAWCPIHLCHKVHRFI